MSMRDRFDRRRSFSDGGNVPSRTEHRRRGAGLRSATRVALASLVLLAVPLAATGGTVGQVAGAASSPTLTVTTSQLPTAAQGSPYVTSLSAAGEVGAVRWSIASGVLPAGLALTSAGQISGVPVSTTSTFVASVSDSASPPHTASKSLTLTVTPSAQLAVQSSQVVQATQGTPVTFALGAFGGTAPVTWQVSSGTLPAGLTLSASGVLSGTPRAAGSQTVTVAVTDASSPVPQSATGSVTIAVQVGASLAVTTKQLPAATVGQGYAYSLATAGGVAPDYWSISSGALPAGLTLSTSGELSGTPMTAGSSTFSVHAWDSASPTAGSATQPLTLVTAAGGALALTGGGVSGTITQGQGQGNWWANPIYVSGGTAPYTWSITSGSLPPGMTLYQSGNYFIPGGIPTASGTYNYIVGVSDATTPVALNASQVQSIVVEAALPLSTAPVALPEVTEASWYSAQLRATGGVAPYSWAVTSGSLPPGLTLLSDGEIYGTATGPGIAAFTASVTDSASPTPGVAQEPLTIQVDAAPALTITTAGLPSGVQGKSYSAILSTAGGVGDVAWTIGSGALPAGLELDSYGNITGSPSVSGSFPVTFVATDSASPVPNVATDPVTLVISPPGPLAIAALSSTTVVQGQQFNCFASATGGTGGLTWSLASGALPTGVQFYSNGELYGYPTSSGTFTFTIQATDSGSPVPSASTRAVTVTVTPAPALTVTSTQVPSAIRGTYYQTTLQSTGAVYSYSWSLVSGSLPTGMQINSYGTLYGTPTASGTYALTFRVTDGATPTPRSATASFSFVVAPSATLAIVTSTLPSSLQNSYYSQRFAATGGFGSYTWSFVSGSLPPGVSLDSYGDLYGTPTTSGTFTFTERVSDSDTPTANKASALFTLYVAPAGVLSIQSPSTLAFARGQSSDNYLYAIGATGSVAWSVSSGSLPTGMYLSPSGHLFGTPTVVGTDPVTLRVTDSTVPTPAVATLAVVFTVGQPSALVIAARSLQAGEVGTPYGATVYSTGGYGTDTWSLSSGALPPGVLLNSGGGLVGTPTAIGTYSFTLAVTDSATPTPAVATIALAITVNPAAPVVIEPATLSNGQVGLEYYDYVGAYGGAAGLTWSTVSGSLPTGLTFGAYGDLSGTPLTSGTFSFTVEARDLFGHGAVETLVLTIDPPDPVSVVTPSLPSGKQGVYYSASMQASGGAGPYAWSSNSGHLPEGLSISNAGQIFGWPAVAGTFTFTVIASDLAQPAPDVATRTMTLTILSGTPFAITTTNLSSGVVGESYGATFSLGGIVWSPVTIHLASGTLPPGVTLTAAGELSGQPTTIGTYAFTVQAVDSALPTPQVATALYTITIGPEQPLAAVSGGETVPLGSGSIWFSWIGLLAYGGIGPYTCSLAPGSSLPPGISLTPNCSWVGVTTSVGRYSFSVLVTDSARPTPGMVTSSVDITVTPAYVLSVSASVWPTATQGDSVDEFFNAGGGVGSDTYSVAPGSSLPPGLSLTADGKLSGQITSSGTFTFTVTATDSATPVPNTASVSTTITVSPAPRLTIMWSPPTSAVEGESYYGNAATWGGVGQVTWSIASGSLPAGLTLAQDSWYASVQGTPTVSGTFTFDLRGTDSATPTPDVVDIPMTLTVSPAQPLVFDSFSMNNAVKSQPYADSLYAYGGVGPYTWAVTSGSLPSGVGLSSTGQFSGYPGSAGSFAFTVTATDSASPPQTATGPLSLEVYPAVPLVTVSGGLQSGIAGQPYDTPLGASGGAQPYTWIATGGHLPAGLTLSSAGELSGVPTTAGNFSFTYAVNDSSGPTPLTSTGTESVQIGPAVPLAIVATSLALGTAGLHYDATLAAFGGIGPFTWSVASGSFPPGLTLLSTGEVSGYVTAAGTYSFTVAATDSSPGVPQVAYSSISLTFGPATPLAVTATSLPAGMVGTAYSATLNPVGGIGPCVWSVAGGQVPSGLVLGSAGTLAGIPTAAGTYSFIVGVMDSASPVHATANTTVTVVIAPPGNLNVLSYSMPDATMGAPYDAAFPMTGGYAPFTWSIQSGSLPVGISLNPTGRLVGTPTSIGTTTFVVAVVDAFGDGVSGWELTLAVVPDPPVAFASTTLSMATQGRPYGTTLNASGGTAPFHWWVVSGSLPSGLTLSSAGSITGSPTAAGSYSFTVSAADAAGHAPPTPTEQLNLVVAPPPLTTVPVVLPTAVVGVAYTATVAASGGTGPYHWSVAIGSLPDGLSLQGSTGVISGTPLTAGQSSHCTLQVTDASTPIPRTALLAVSVIVSPGPLGLPSTALPAATEGQSFTTAIDPVGGFAPYVVTLSSGALPAGLTLQSSGEISGVPTTAGTTSFTLAASDGTVPQPLVTTASYAITVLPPPLLQSLTTTLPNGGHGVAYYEQLAALGGVGPYTWVLLSGPLAPGLVLDSSGAISGVPTTGGTYAIVVGISDAALIPDSASIRLTLTIVDSGPTLSTTASPAAGVAPFATHLVVISGQASDDPLQYTVHFGDGSTDATGSIATPYAPLVLAHSFSASGSFLVTTTVTDTVTGLSTSTTTPFTVAPARTKPPTALLQATSTGGVAPLTTTLSVSGSDPGGASLTYTLDFGDGTGTSSGSLSDTVNVSHIYSTAGSYAALLQVSDGLLVAYSVVHVQVAPNIPTVAMAGDNQVGTVGVPVRFDGTGSQPSGAISSYQWAFGDGTTATVVSPSHTYTTVGTYTATLTVTASGTSSSSSSTITVDPVVKNSGLLVTISGGSALLAGAEALVVQGDATTVTGLSNGSGVATLSGLADGTYTAYVYAGGYVPASVTTTVSGGIGAAAINLTPGPVASATLTATNMTLAQILAAGIDPNAPGNSVVVNFAVHLAVNGDTYFLHGNVCGLNFCGNTGFGSGSGSGGSGGISSCSASSCVTGTVQQVHGQPTITWMILPGKASFLKQFFNVQMLVQNLAPSSLSFTSGSATLALPAGLSLAPTPTPQQLTQTMADIAGGSSATAQWIVRGDTEGIYDLSANYSGLLQPFAAPVSLVATSASPLKVWGASAISFVVTADDNATTGYPYLATVGLTNVADVPIYNVALSLANQFGSNFIYQPKQNLSASATEIDPGQTVQIRLRLVPEVTGGLDLSRSFVANIGGVSSSPSSITSQPAALPSTFPTLTVASQPDGIHLQWEVPSSGFTGGGLLAQPIPIPGITGYQIFYTPSPSTPFGPTPVATVSASTLSKVIANGAPGSYAVSAVVNGVPTMYSPLEGVIIPPPLITVSPDHVIVGATAKATFTGSGFGSGQTVTLYLDSSSSKALGSAKATSSGTISKKLSITSSVVGVHQLIAVSSNRPTESAPFTVRPPLTYAALGDSYSSGEGLATTASGYIYPSNGQTVNGAKDNCHRDTLAYPQLVKTAMGVSDANFKFVACSGATTGQTVDQSTSSPFGHPYETILNGMGGEPGQLDVLNGNTQLVTLTGGGNDSGFANIARACISLFIKLGPLSHTFSAPFSLISGDLGCAGDLSWASQLVTGSSTPGQWSNGSPIEQALESYYGSVLSQAPTAQVNVVNYPQLFTTGFTGGFCPIAPGFTVVPPGPIAGSTIYAGFDSNQLQQFNTLEDGLNQDIAAAVDAVSFEYSNRIHLVDVNAATQTTALPCNTKKLAKAGINGLSSSVGSGITNIADQVCTALLVCDFSTIALDFAFTGTQTLHPKAVEHAQMGKLVTAAIRNEDFLGTVIGASVDALACR